MARKKAQVGWHCPECGVGAHRHPRGMKNRNLCVLRDGSQCEGLICECSSDDSDLPNHATAENPCHNAVCYHCGWGGTIPVEAEPKKPEGATLTFLPGSKMKITTVSDRQQFTPMKVTTVSDRQQFTPSKPGPLVHWSLAIGLDGDGRVTTSAVVLTLEPFSVTIPITDDQRELIEAMRKAVYSG